MNIIVEAELVAAFKNNAVEKISIIQTKNNKFKIVVNLCWKAGDLTLVTYRKKPREWVDINRLIQHMRENYHSHLLKQINLSLEPLDKYVELEKQKTP